MTAPARSGGLRVLYPVSRQVKEKMERGELKFRSLADAMWALLGRNKWRILEVRIGSAVAYIAADVDADEYYYTNALEEALRFVAREPGSVVLMTWDEMREVARKATVEQ
jgi:hypothetical protein